MVLRTKHSGLHTDTQMKVPQQKDWLLIWALPDFYPGAQVRDNILQSQGGHCVTPEDLKGTQESVFETVINKNNPPPQKKVSKKLSECTNDNFPSFKE